jgi:hypothetical protein
MPKYNGSRSLPGIAAIGLLCLAGCSQTPERVVAMPRPPPAGAAMADEPPSTAPEPLPLAEAEPVADPVPVREDAPLRYVVKKGDTLWDISKRYLLEPWQWPEIWYVNDQVANPHLIYPGDVLTLVWRDGRPAVVRAAPDLDVEYLSPQIREVPLDQAIPTIPLDVIRDFLRSPRVVAAEDLEDAPYVLGFADPRLMVGAGSQVYLKNMPEGEPLYQYAAVRIGERYIDPDSGELLGWEALPVADVELRSVGEPATAMIARSYRETRAGDRLIEAEAETFEANFYPRPAEAALAGRIISVFDGVSQIGQYQVVTLNRGMQDGLIPGHVLDIYQAGRKTRDPYTGRMEPLPEVYAGTAMVFKVDERVSFALVMDAVREIHVYDRVRGPGT